MLAPALIIASSAIVLLLGTLHLIYTFATDKFQPRDPALAERMRQVSPMITRQTSLWRAWVGFNASHSLGAMLFGLVYGYLAWLHPALLLEARGLLLIGWGFSPACGCWPSVTGFAFPWRASAWRWCCSVRAPCCFSAD